MYKTVRYASQGSSYGGRVKKKASCKWIKYGRMHEAIRVVRSSCDLAWIKIGIESFGVMIVCLDTVSSNSLMGILCNTRGSAKLALYGLFVMKYEFLKSCVGPIC